MGIGYIVRRVCCGSSPARVAAMQARLAEVKRRGRWASDTSVQRYEQSARLAQQLHAMPPAIREKAVAAEKRIAEVLAVRWTPW